MARTLDAEALVVGAGAAGLAAAAELRRRGADVLTLEAGERPGGVIRSERRGGFLFEHGPNSLRVSGPFLELLRRHGLQESLLRASPAGRRRFLLRGGRLEPVPMGPLAFARTPLLSPRGKARLLAEPFVRRGDAEGESVADFVRRRLGAEALARLVAPFLVGVYAGRADRLGAEAVFPALCELERRYGSLALGGLVRAFRPEGPRGLPGTWSAPQGLGALPAHLARGLGESLRLGARVRALRPERRGWRVALEGAGGRGEELTARRVVLAADAAGAAALLRPLDAEAAALVSGVPYVPLAGVHLDADPARARRHPIEGFGFLVPEEEGLDLLGGLFPSRLFPERAPEGRALVTALVGGARWPEVAEASEKEIVERAMRGLERALGLDAAHTLAVLRWRRAVAQPGPDHPRRVAALRERTARLPGLALAGSYLEGVSVPDTMLCGARAAEALAGESG